MNSETSEFLGHSLKVRGVLGKKKRKFLTPPPIRVFFLSWRVRRALVPSSGAQEDLHQSGGVFLAVELASAAPDSIVHPGQHRLRIVRTA